MMPPLHSRRAAGAWTKIIPSAHPVVKIGEPASAEDAAGSDRGKDEAKAPTDCGVIL
jgi:hypothetical protein